LAFVITFVIFVPYMHVKSNRMYILLYSLNLVECHFENVRCDVGVTVNHAGRVSVEKDEEVTVGTGPVSVILLVVRNIHLQ
jgi:hypothetical protein